MKFFKTIHSKISRFILIISKKKIIGKLYLNNIDLDNLSLQEFNSLVKNEKHIVICNSKRIGSGIAIGIFLGMWVYTFLALWSQNLL